MFGEVYNEHEYSTNEHHDEALEYGDLTTTLKCKNAFSCTCKCVLVAAIETLKIYVGRKYTLKYLYSWNIAKKRSSFLGRLLGNIFYLKAMHLENTNSARLNVIFSEHYVVSGPHRRVLKALIRNEQ